MSAPSGPIPEMLCRFGDGSLAVVILDTPEGCVCYPGDRQQLLCAQHFIKDGMHEGAKVLWILPEFEAML